MPTAIGYVFKAVSAQLAEMDEMDVPDKEWNIFDMEELTTEEVIAKLSYSRVPFHNTLAEKLQNILDCEGENDEES